MKKLLSLLLATGGVFAQLSPNSLTLTKNSPGKITGLNYQVVGGSGFGSYWYWVVPTYPVGQGQIQGGQAVGLPSLSVSAYVQLRWNDAPGAISYTVLRTNTSTPPSGTATNAVATGLTSPFAQDVGAALTSFTVSTAPSVTGVEYIDNQNYADARFVFSLPVQVSKLCFSDGTCQITAGGGGSGGYNQIEVNGAGVTQRTTLNLVNGFGIIPSAGDVGGKTVLSWGVDTTVLKIGISQPIVFRVQTTGGAFNTNGMGASGPSANFLTDNGVILGGAYVQVNAVDSGTPTAYAQTELADNWDQGAVTLKLRLTQATGAGSGNVKWNVNWACIETSTNMATIAWSTDNVMTVITPAFGIVATGSVSFTPTCGKGAGLAIRAVRDITDTWPNSVNIHLSAITQKIVLD